MYRRISLSKEEIKVIRQALKIFPVDIESRRETYEWEHAPFSFEKRMRLIQECNEHLEIVKKLEKRLKGKNNDSIY